MNKICCQNLARWKDGGSFLTQSKQREAQVMGGSERVGLGRSSISNAPCLRCLRFILDRELGPEEPECMSLCFRGERGQGQRHSPDNVFKGGRLGVVTWQ